MSINYNPTLVKDGLIFYYDTSNTKKSFLGRPVTNVQSTTSGNKFGNEYDPWSNNGGIVNNVTDTILQGPVANAKTWQFIKTGSGNQWHGWEGSYGTIWTGSSGDIWTTSYWYKTSNSSGIGTFSVGGFALNDWSRAYNVTVLAEVRTIIADGQWHYNYSTTQFNENYTNAIITDGPSWDYSTTAGQLLINGLQWSKSSYAAPFATGTRSVTGSLVDMVGGKTIDVTNAGWDSNSNIIFNGSSNYIDVTSNLGVLNAYTFSFWTKMDATDKFSISSRTVNAFYWFGDNSWKYTHNGTGGEFYYTHVTTVSTGSWSMYTVTYDGININIYRNGIFQGTTTSWGSADFTNGLRIGGSYVATYLYQGNIPIVAMYNRALSQDEITQNFEAHRGRYSI